MIQFLFVMIGGSAVAWIAGAATEIHPLLVLPVFAAIIWCAWLLQSDEEKEATRKWWYDRL